MRIGAGSGGPLSSLDGLVSSIQETFMGVMRRATSASKVRVMLGDATVTEQATFDPILVRRVFAGVAGGLAGWRTDGVMSTNNEDIRRVFVKFQTSVGNYRVSGHLSIQFHVLLYYVPRQRVIDCQKELSEIIDATKVGEDEMAAISDRMIAGKLASMGYGSLDHQDLFEVLYGDDSLRASLESQLDGGREDAARRLSQRKTDLFAELDSLLCETYQTSPVLIDDARLVTGEEGCLCTFDIEYVRGRERRPIPSKIAPKTLDLLGERLAQVGEAMRVAGESLYGDGAAAVRE